MSSARRRLAALLSAGALIAGGVAMSVSTGTAAVNAGTCCSTHK
jgi:hypothetical protein